MAERPAPQLSLLDTLPLFVELAVRTEALYGDAAAHQWRVLAGRYMAAAAVEAYLVCGAEGPGALREAFAWGVEGEGEEGVCGDGWEVERGKAVRMVSFSWVSFQWGGGEGFVGRGLMACS